MNRIDKIEYTVKEGDTLEGLSLAFNIELPSFF